MPCGPDGSRPGPVRGLRSLPRHPMDTDRLESGGAEGEQPARRDARRPGRTRRGTAGARRPSRPGTAVLTRPWLKQPRKKRRTDVRSAHRSRGWASGREGPAPLPGPQDPTAASLMSPSGEATSFQGLCCGTWFRCSRQALAGLGDPHVPGTTSQQHGRAVPGPPAAPRSHGHSFASWVFTQFPAVNCPSLPPVGPPLKPGAHRRLPGRSRLVRHVSLGAGGQDTGSPEGPRFFPVTSCPGSGSLSGRPPRPCGCSEHARHVGLDTVHFDHSQHFWGQSPVRPQATDVL